MKKVLRILFRTILLMIAFAITVIGSSLAYYRYDGLVNVKKDWRISDISEYHRNIAVNHCANAEPWSEAAESKQDCCISSVRKMAANNGRLAPRIFTDDPSRGCGQGTYMRILCNGSLEWCEE